MCVCVCMCLKEEGDVRREKRREEKRRREEQTRVDEQVQWITTGDSGDPALSSVFL